MNANGGEALLSTGFVPLVLGGGAAIVTPSWCLQLPRGLILTPQHQTLALRVQERVLMEGKL